MKPIDELTPEQEDFILEESREASADLYRKYDYEVEIC